MLHYVSGYGYVFFALIYGLRYVGGGCGSNGSYGSLCGSADEGAEKAIGKGVEPCVHVYHVAVYHTGVGGVDVYALWGETFCQVSGEEGDSKF